MDTPDGESDCVGGNESTGVKDYVGIPENDSVLNNRTLIYVPKEVLNETIVSEQLENTSMSMDNYNENHEAGYSTPLKKSRRGRIIKRPARYND